MNNGGMTFAKFFPSDWRTGCMVLNLEEEGLYIRVCMYQYDTGNWLPADDNRAARLLNVQIQKYRKVIESLIAKKKLFKAQGYLINERVQRELEKYWLEREVRSKAAKDREAAKKAYLQREIDRALKGERPMPTPQATPRVTPQATPPLPSGGDLAPPPDVPREVNTKKAKEIKGDDTTAVPVEHHSRGTNPEARSQKPESQDNSGGESRAGGAPPLINLGFEGLRLNFTDADVRLYRENYPHLDYPRDMRVVESMVARQASLGMSDTELLFAFEGALARRDLEMSALQKQSADAARSKADQDHHADCWRDEAGRIQVANGFEVELLETLGGDSKRLRIELDKADAFVGNVKGGELVRKVRSGIAKQVGFALRDAGKKRGDVVQMRDRVLGWVEELVETGKKGA